MTDYLRNRPFMLITYSRTPLPGVKTQLKGWGQGGDEVWDVNENMIIVDRVSDKHMRECDVILDLIHSRVVKCRIGDVQDSTIVTGYVDRYYNDVKTAMAKWVANDTANLDLVRTISKTYDLIDSEEGKS
jgi:hypothetical protein